MGRLSVAIFYSADAYLCFRQTSAEYVPPDHTVDAPRTMIGRLNVKLTREMDMLYHSQHVQYMVSSVPFGQESDEARLLDFGRFRFGLDSFLTIPLFAFP
jgi:hypothetical protein